MKDLTESSTIFEASSRFQSAASALAKVGRSETLDAGDRENLAWTGRFLAEVDSTTNPNGSGIAGNLSVKATDVRPCFYTALLNFQKEFAGLGIQTMDDLRSYLSEAYRFLLAAGDANLPEKGLRPAEKLLHELAKALLVRLTGNGVAPRIDLHRRFLRL